MRLNQQFQCELCFSTRGGGRGVKGTEVISYCLTNATKRLKGGIFSNPQPGLVIRPLVLLCFLYPGGRFAKQRFVFV